MVLYDRVARSFSILSVPLLAGLFAVAGCGGSTSDTSGGSGGSAGTAAGGADAGNSGGSGAGGGSAGSGGSGIGGAGGATAKKCFAGIENGIVYVNYDQFHPVINSTCSGTNHQDIQGVEKLVFLGDSITEGTPPTPASGFYRTLVTNNMKKKFGQNLEVADCAKWGARDGDLAGQIQKCFPTTPEPKKTLTVFTMGGNDLADMAKNHLDVTAATAQADQAIADTRSAVEWLKDPKNFPNGSYVVFANVYEYTDLSANLDSCPLASTAGLSGTWQTGVSILTHVDEQYMKIAVDTQSDMIFMEESFCGHGYENTDKSLQCYRGPNTERWFDLTCIHPTPKGHSVIADLFTKTIEE